MEIRESSAKFSVKTIKKPFNSVWKSSLFFHFSEQSLCFLILNYSITCSDQEHIKEPLKSFIHKNHIKVMIRACFSSKFQAKIAIAQAWGSEGEDTTCVGAKKKQPKKHMSRSELTAGKASSSQVCICNFKSISQYHSNRHASLNDSPNLLVIDWTHLAFNFNSFELGFLRFREKFVNLGGIRFSYGHGCDQERKPSNFHVYIFHFY